MKDSSTIIYFGHCTMAGMFKKAKFEDFISWLRKQSFYQLDVETNVVDHLADRVLKTIQFGAKNIQVVLQWNALTIDQQEVIVEILNDPKQLKLIHYAVFEYTILSKYGVVLENVYDTHIAEKVIWGGLDGAGYSLADLCQRYLCVELDKTLQTSFDVEVLTPGQVMYAAEDVKYLEPIRRMQIEKLKAEDLDYVAGLEMEVVLALGDIEANGMKMDKEAWLKLVDIAQPKLEEAKETLDNWIRKLPAFKEHAIENGYYSEQDRVMIKWGSPEQRKRLLQLMVPSLELTTKPAIQKYLKACQGSTEKKLLELYLSAEFEVLNQHLLTNHRQWLVDEGFCIPADTVTINWGSQAQVFGLFKTVMKRLKNLNADTLAGQNHPVIKDLLTYREFLKKVTTYGEEFLNKYVQSDGYVRTSFNQIVSTGRLSSKKPNVQNIIADNAYRNPFGTEEGWRFVSSDLMSQELATIAFISQDPVWISCLQKSQDLHSVCAALVFKQKWKDAADSDCAFYAKNEEGEQLYQKCSCKKHKELRDHVKSINFG